MARRRTTSTLSSPTTGTPTSPAPCNCVSARYVLALWGFLGFFITFSMRASFSVAVVAMVSSTASSPSAAAAAADITGDDPHAANASETRAGQQGEFPWDELTQGLVLGAFYYGYPCTQVTAGPLTARFGGRLVFAFGIFASVALAFVIPVAARVHVYLLMAVRVLQGLAEGTTGPAMHAMWGVWAPTNERSRLANFTYAGMEVGTVVGMMMSGVLSQYGFAGGWPSVFYLHGALGCCWVMMWLLLVHDSPDEHPRISEAEKSLIGTHVPQKQAVKIPWRHLVTSGAVWATVVNHFSVAWGFMAMVSCLPIYMNKVLHLNIEQNGLLSSLPFLVQWVTEMGGSVLADVILIRGWLSIELTRKLMNTVGAVMAAVFMVIAGYTEWSPVVSVAMITATIGVSAFCNVTVRVMHLDIAPRYAGTLFGISNAIASIPGFIAPTMLGALDENSSTIEQWRIFFCMTAVLYLLGALVFGLLAKGKELWWAKASPTPSTTTFASSPDYPTKQEADAGVGMAACEEESLFAREKYTQPA